MKPFSQQFAQMFLRLFFGAVFLVIPGVVFAAPFDSVEVVNLTNRDREEYGLSKLQWDDHLVVAAEAKARDMVEHFYFSHTSPEGIRPWFFFEEVGYRYRFAGENLAIHFTDAESEEAAWMASEKHRENILSPKYRDTGVAVVEMFWEGKATILTVQLFGTRIGDAVPDVSLLSSPSSLKNFSDDAPTVSGTITPVSLPIEEKNHFSSTAPPIRFVSSDPSSFFLSDASLRSLFFATIFGILLLEITAGVIVFRIFSRRKNVFHLRVVASL